MKLWMSALVVVLISSQSFAADAAKHTEDAVTAPEVATTAKPVAEKEPYHVRYARAVNACLLQQGAAPSLDNAFRAIGEDLNARTK